MKTTLKNIDTGWITQLARTFPKGEIFLVGGAVRDMLLGRETKDYDFVVRNIPAKKLETFFRRYGRVDLVGRVFGVLKFIPTRYKLHATSSFEPFDIALPRTEHTIAHTGGYKDFAVQSNHMMPIEDDLSRRDFTINAIALRLQATSYKPPPLAGPRTLRWLQATIDPFGGQDDIKKKIIRTVGKPEQRFKEDYSRMLRAIRFACQLGFTIEPKTKTAIKKLGKHLNDQKDHIFTVPRETIGRELSKAFTADPVCAMALVDELGLVHVLMPELLKMKKCPQPVNWHSEGDVWTHTQLALKTLKKKYPSRNALLTFAVLVHDVAKPVCLRTPARHNVDRVRFDGHDKKGGDIARMLGARLGLSSTAADSCYHVDIEKLGWLVDHHLLLMNDPRKFTNRTLEKYFFTPTNPGAELLALTYCDIAATIHANTRKPDFTHFRRLARRLDALKKLGVKSQLPPPLISGDDVMRVLHIPPGPTVGDILGKIREQQLAQIITTKSDARAYLKKKFAQN